MLLLVLIVVFLLLGAAVVIALLVAPQGELKLTKEHEIFDVGYFVSHMIRIALFVATT